MTTLPLLRSFLEPRLALAGAEWLRSASAEIADGVDDGRFSALLSSASRRVRKDPLAPSDEERRRAGSALEGWNPERWTLREAARVALVLSRTDLAVDTGPRAILGAFRYADQGELCALYRSLAHLPQPEHYLWQAKEGCRTNMTVVFEADVCDTPYPFRHFDDLAWNQALIKAVFVGAPVWRVFGLDRRLSPDLARMALDLADERRSAHRLVQPDLWLLLGAHGGERGLASLERELATREAPPAEPGAEPTADPENVLGRRAAAYALGRTGATAKLESALASEPDERVAAALRDALDGRTDAAVFRHLSEPLDASRT